MNREGRSPSYTQDQFDEVWRLYRSGSKLWDIAQILDINPGSIHIILHRYGGIAPPKRKPREGRLTVNDREEISRGIASGESMRAIAKRLGRPPSTISREALRNGGKDRYRAARAQKHAMQQLRRPKPCLLDVNEKSRNHVIARLQLDWSPEQIAGELPLSYPDDKSMRISHETIYRSIFIQARGALEKESRSHLRSRRKLRKSRGSESKEAKQGRIIDALSIRERPAEAEDRAVPGHWEGDLVFGTIDSQVATLVERTSRFLMIVKIPAKRAPDVSSMLARHVGALPDQLKKSATWDRGSEMADRKQFTIDSGARVCFCDPRSPWQRGGNENANGLLRQYLPKGEDISHCSQKELDEIALRLNTRPRKTLGFMTPAVKLEEVLR